MKNKLFVLVLSFVLVFAFTGCGKEKVVEVAPEETVKEVETENIQIKVGAPAGSPLLSAIKLFNEETQFEGADVSYEIIQSPDKIPAMIINGELDMAIIPTNLAAILYNKEVPYKLVSANVFGVMYVISDGSVEINSFEDLKGKEINTMGRNLTPDITFRHLLKSNGIDPDKDLTLNYLSGATELAPAFLAGKSTITVMPEPMLSLVMSKKEETKIIFDIQEEWSKLTGIAGGYPQASLFVKSDIIDNHKEVLDQFLNSYMESCKWINENPMDAGNYYGNLVEGVPGAIIGKSIPRNNIDFIYAEDAKVQIDSYLKTLFEYDPKTLGGKLPDEGFYYKK